MEALAERLSHLDSQAEGALRVVMFYDTLMRRRVDLPALARASAGLAECVAGIRLHGTGRTIRMSPDGGQAPAPPPPTSTTTTAPITLDEEEIGTVWLERPGPRGRLDDMVLDRLAIAVAAVVERYGPARTTMADPALVELAISADSDQAARARALRLLGFAADLPVRVAAVRSPLPLDQVGGLVCPARPVKAAPLADVGVILATTLDPVRFPAGVRAGIGTAESPGRSWRQARTALRFTGPREPVIRYDNLGALALLAEVPPDAARDNADVTAIARMAGNPEDLETLDAYCHTGSPTPGRRPSPPAPQQRRPPTRTARKDPGHRTHRAHRTDTGQARPHRMAAPQRLRPADGLVGEDVEAEAVAAGCQGGDDPVEEGPRGP